MTRQITTVELGLFERMVPLLGGYLEASVSLDAELKRDFRFAKRSIMSKKVRSRELLGHLASDESDVYAFSCYVWNIGTIMRLIPELLAARPEAQIILGGPQVMHQGGRYLRPDQERVTICNGEGERTFADYLRAICAPTPDLTAVLGLSFFRDGGLVTTSPCERMSDLDTTPSPFLSGLFDADYSFTVFETNRGCPFHCGFCYWGAATNDRVYRFSDARVSSEIEWIGRKGIPFVHIADANWGISKRDVEFSRQFAQSRTSWQAPTMIYFSAAKNSPERVTEITEILREAEIATSQPVSLQTLNERSLEIIQRTNIRRAAYEHVHHNLQRLGIASYTEMIWPLPGETLASFELGMQQLCEMGTDTIVVYPHVLLVNTPLYNRRDELRLVTRTTGDIAGKAEIVVSTMEVTPPECDDGMRLFYSIYLLHNLRALRAVGHFLHTRGICQYRSQFRAFANYMRQNNEESPIARFVEGSLATLDYFDTFNYGKLVHYSLHQDRGALCALLRGFVSSCAWWAHEEVRVLFELDQLTMPYVYTSTPLTTTALGDAKILVNVSQRAFDVEIPADYVTVWREYVPAPLRDHVGGRYRITHAQGQLPYFVSQDLDHSAGYCFGMSIRIDQMAPTWAAI